MDSSPPFPSQAFTPSPILDKIQHCWALLKYQVLINNPKHISYAIRVEIFQQCYKYKSKSLQMGLLELAKSPTITMSLIQTKSNIEYYKPITRNSSFYLKYTSQILNDFTWVCILVEYKIGFSQISRVNIWTVSDMGKQLHTYTQLLIDPISSRLTLQTVSKAKSTSSSA